MSHVWHGPYCQSFLSIHITKATCFGILFLGFVCYYKHILIDKDENSTKVIQWEILSCFIPCWKWGGSVVLIVGKKHILSDVK